MEEEVLEEEVTEKESDYTLGDKDGDYSLDDESIYSEDVRNELLEDDELSPFEEGFMRGYEEAID